MWTECDLVKVEDTLSILEAGHWTRWKTSWQKNNLPLSTQLELPFAAYLGHNQSFSRWGKCFLCAENYRRKKSFLKNTRPLKTSARLTLDYLSSFYDCTDKAFIPLMEDGWYGGWVAETTTEILLLRDQHTGLRHIGTLWLTINVRERRAICLCPEQWACVAMLRFQVLHLTITHHSPTVCGCLLFQRYHQSISPEISPEHISYCPSLSTQPPPISSSASTW